MYVQLFVEYEPKHYVHLRSCISPLWMLAQDLLYDDGVAMKFDNNGVTFY
jgi:hypothetical protein